MLLQYLQLAQRGQPLPTVDFIRKKSKRIEQAKSFQFKEEDIDKVLYVCHPTTTTCMYVCSLSVELCPEIASHL